MGSFAPAGKTSQFKDGTKKKVEIQGHEILIARVGDKYYATVNRCPHLNGDLSRGKLEGTTITCNSHGSRFDISDGHVVRWLKGYGTLSVVSEEFKLSRKLKTYAIKVEGDTILVEI
ncbi:Rieske (2Fe-2S) protein [Chloroflexota bacterium]